MGKYADLREAFDALMSRCEYLERRSFKKDRKRSTARRRVEELEEIYRTEVQDSIQQRRKAVQAKEDEFKQQLRQADDR